MKLKAFLAEMPLGKLEFHGDTQPGSFDEKDIKAIHNPKWIQKVNSHFSRTPYNFNVFLVNAKEGKLKFGKKKYDVKDLSNLKYWVGLRDDKFIEKAFPHIDIPDKKTSINCFIIENEGASKISLTPWILVHRIVHAFLDKCPSLYRHIAVFYQNYFGVMRSIAKPKSIKTGNLSTGAEAIVELIVQYIVQGSISFDKTDIDSLDKKIEADTHLLNQYCKKALDGCVGRCFVL